MTLPVEQGQLLRNITELMERLYSGREYNSVEDLVSDIAGSSFREQIPNSPFFVSLLAGELFAFVPEDFVGPVKIQKVSVNLASQEEDVIWFDVYFSVVDENGTGGLLSGGLFLSREGVL